jgi:hypothetical protein
MISEIFKKKYGKSKIVKSVVKLHYRNIFGLTFIIGSASIVIGWLINAPFWLGVGFPVLILIIYSSLGIFEEKDETLIEQYADSIYFLGFLFTLVALIVSLLALSEDNYSLEGVGSRFGIALTTTIIGLFLRIFLTNFRSSFSSKKAIVEDQLAQTIKLYSYEVLSHARTLRSTTEAYKNSMDHATTSMQKTFEELNVELRSVATQGVAKINKSIEISFEENQRFSDILRELNETTKKLNDSIKDIMDTFSPVKELEINATGLNNSINKTATIIENMSANLSQLDDIQPNIKMFASSISDINKATSGLSTALNNHEIVISEIGSLSNSQLEIVKNHQKEIEETMKKSRDNLGLLNDGLMQSVQFITDELGRKTSGG